MSFGAVYFPYVWKLRCEVSARLAKFRKFGGQISCSRGALLPNFAQYGNFAAKFRAVWELHCQISTKARQENILHTTMLTIGRCDFRPQFTKLDTLRHYLERVPFGACTATCTPEKMTRICECLAIRRDAIAIVEGIDRPN